MLTCVGPSPPPVATLAISNFRSANSIAPCSPSWSVIASAS